MAELTYEPVTDEALLEPLSRILNQAFGQSGELKLHLDWLKLGSLEWLRQVRLDGELVACLRRFEMGHHFGGRGVKSVGIAGVAVQPTHRGQGIAKEMMRRCLAEARAEGYPLSTLYASTYRLYHMLGYERAGSRYILHVDPRQLSFSARGTSARPLTEEDESTVERVFYAMAKHLSGEVMRTDYLWQRTQGSPEKPTHGVLFSEGDEPVGYMRWIQIPHEHGLYRIAITDMAVCKPSGAHAALNFISRHGTLAERASWASGPGDPLLALLPDRYFELKHSGDWLIRVLNVRTALEGRGYAPGLTAELHFEFEDDLFADNAGRMVLKVEDGVGRVEPGGSGNLALSVRALAPLYSGHLSAQQLALTGWLDSDSGSLRLADAVFAGPTPWMTDDF